MKKGLKMDKIIYCNSLNKFNKLLNEKNLIIFVSKSFSERMGSMSTIENKFIKRKQKENNIIIKEIKYIEKRG